MALLADPGTKMQFSQILCRSIKRRRILQFTVYLSAWCLIQAESPAHISTYGWSQPLKESPSSVVEVPDTLLFHPGLITTTTADQAFPSAHRNSPASTIRFHTACVRSVAPLVHLSPFCASVTQNLKLDCCDSDNLVAHGSGVRGIQDQGVRDPQWSRKVVAVVQRGQGAHRLGSPYKGSKCIPESELLPPCSSGVLFPKGWNPSTERLTEDHLREPVPHWQEPVSN